MVNTAQMMESHYGHLFEKVIVNDDLSTAYSELQQALKRLETETQWVPVSWTHSWDPFWLEKDKKAKPAFSYYFSFNLNFLLVLVLWRLMWKKDNTTWTCVRVYEKNLFLGIIVDLDLRYGLIKTYSFYSWVLLSRVWVLEDGSSFSLGYPIIAEHRMRVWTIIKHISSFSIFNTIDLWGKKWENELLKF